MAVYVDYILTVSQASLMVSTIDCRKQPLVFKASIYELRQNLLLVEFRRSKVSDSLPICICVSIDSEERRLEVGCFQ